MNRERKIVLKFSGVPNLSFSDGDFSRYCGKMHMNYLYMVSQADFDFPDGKIAYSDLMRVDEGGTLYPLMLNYEMDKKSTYNIEDPALGLYNAVKGGTASSFFRREYENYSRKFWDTASRSLVTEHYELMGKWQPVAISTDGGTFRDYNIKSGHTYQYVMYPQDSVDKQVFAKNGLYRDKYQSDDYIITDEEYKRVTAISSEWQYWSITELIPAENPIDAPILKNTYNADLDNVWIFKYDLNVGDQTQNIQRNQTTTLGQYPRIAHSQQNFLSGNVSCFLGSEIVPYSKVGYIERMRRSISTPLSTNEKALMLAQWRKFVHSKNPKLLKDSKGQSWIVTITGSRNSPKQTLWNQPDIISFDWVEIEDTDKVSIYGSAETLSKKGCPNSIWTAFSTDKKHS